MSAPGTAVVGRTPRHLSKEQAELAVERGEMSKPDLHAVWDEESQSWLPLGEKMVLDRHRREGTPEALLEAYDARRQMVLRFVAEKLIEAEYAKGYPIEGKLHHYYVVPGSTRKALTKTGGEMLADLFRFRRGESVVTSSIETPEYCSARVRCILLDQWGRQAGAHEAAASTAEAGFQAAGARRKYGAKGEWTPGERGRKEWDETSAPDYRAALNDVVARAGKRAFVGAVIVACAADEVFDLAASLGGEGQEQKDEDDGAVRRSARAPAPPARGARPLTINGKPLSMHDTATLEAAYRKLTAAAEPKHARHLEALETELEQRRSLEVLPAALKEDDGDLRLGI